MTEWQKQGDCHVGAVKLCRMNANGKVDVVEAEGAVLVSQTCDVVQPKCRFLQVAPLRKC